MRIVFSSILTLAGLCCAGSAFAQTISTTFPVTANVAGKCRTVTATALAFGAYDPVDINETAPLDGANAISVRCNRGTVATVALDDGVNNPGGSSCAAPLRRMVNTGVPTEFLNYQLYSNAGRTQVWGCDLPPVPTNTVTFTHTLPSSQSTVLPVFGQIPGGQDALVGGYLDTIAVTVTF